ncbi:MAG: hypothetical protein JXR88_07030 [Clostridia bacterium]|nr:hypothetical protein [Clostridia bacterium]
MKKGLIIVLLVCLMSFAYGQEPADISIILDGNNLIMEQPSYIQDGRTLVPVRFLFEPLGLKVSWDEDNFTAIGEKEDLYIEMPIGSSYATINGEMVVLDVPAVIYNNRTYVPLRFVSEATGAKVTWRGDTKTIFIESDGLGIKDTYYYLNHIYEDSVDYNGPNFLSNRVEYHEIIDQLTELKTDYKSYRDELNEALIRLANNANVHLNQDNLVANMEMFHDKLMPIHLKDTDKDASVGGDGYYNLQYDSAYYYTYIKNQKFSGYLFGYHDLGNVYLLTLTPYSADLKDGVGYELVFSKKGNLIYEGYALAEKGVLSVPKYVKYTDGIQSFYKGNDSDLVLMQIEKDGTIYIPPYTSDETELYGVGYEKFANGVEYVGYFENYERLGEGLYFGPEDDYTLETNLLDLRAEEILEEVILPHMTNLEKIKGIHDYLASHIIYDMSNEENISDMSHTAYGALIQGSAVCDGYAEAFKYLLDKVNIENVLIFGEASETGDFVGEINHAWNLVKINNLYKHFDMTWDDDDMNQKIRYTYFNQTSDFMDDTHEWHIEKYKAYLGK